MTTLRYGTRAVALAVVLCGAIAALAHAADVNVVGVWKGSMETQMGAVENTITIDAATPLAGTVDVGEYQGKIEKGAVDG